MFAPGVNNSESARIAIPAAAIDLNLLTLCTADTLWALQPELDRLVANGIFTVTGTIDTASFDYDGVSSLHADVSPAIRGDVHLVSGSNVTLSQVGQNITINASGGGGGGSPSAPDTSVQFNNGGSFGGSPAFLWLDSSQNLRLGDPTNLVSDTTIDMQGNGKDAVINMDHTTGNLVLQAHDGSNIVLGGAAVNVGGNGNILLHMDGSASVGTLTVTTGDLTIQNGQLTAPGELDIVTPAGGINIFAAGGNSILLKAGALAGIEIDDNVVGLGRPMFFDTLDTSSRDALTPSSGWMIYNTTNLRPEYYNGTTWLSMAGGGSGSPAGANTQIQFNDNGVFGAVPGLTWTGTFNVSDANGTSGIQGVEVSVQSSVTSTPATLALTGSLGSGILFQVNDDGFLHIANANGNQINLDQNVTGGISFGPSQADPSAQLDMQAIDKGFLPPRVTTVQRDAIATPASGLQIYNTDTNQPEVWNGTSWVAMGGGSGSPAGADTQVQFNSGGAFAADDRFTFEPGFPQWRINMGQNGNGPSQFTEGRVFINIPNGNGNTGFEFNSGGFSSSGDLTTNATQGYRQSTGAGGILFMANSAGYASNFYGIGYVNDGTAGSETVSISTISFGGDNYTVVSVHIQSGVSTVQNVVDAISNDGPASAIITANPFTANTSTVVHTADTAGSAGRFWNQFLFGADGSISSSGTITLGSYTANPTVPPPNAGAMYFNTSDNHFYGYNGTTWKQLDN